MGCKCKRKRIGSIICAVGTGIVLAVLIPFWGWIFAMGCVIIGAGVYVMRNRC